MGPRCGYTLSKFFFNTPCNAQKKKKNLTFETPPSFPQPRKSSRGSYYSHRSLSCRRFTGDITLVSPSISFLAIMILAASLGWYGSQNTYFERSSHIEDVGPHGMIPWNWPPLPQQALLADLNPAQIIPTALMFFIQVVK